MLAYSSWIKKRVKGSDQSKGKVYTCSSAKFAELKGKVKSLRSHRLTASTIYVSLQTSAVDPLPCEPKTPSP